MGVFVTKGGMKSPGSGRVKGTRNKISQAFLEALPRTSTSDGEAAIKIMRDRATYGILQGDCLDLAEGIRIYRKQPLVEIDDYELDAIIEFARRSLERRTLSLASREDETADENGMNYYHAVSEAEILS